MERAAGNPLFLQRLASVGDKTDEADELPETVEALVATRIDRLGPGDRALLRWASVLGVSFSGSLIAEVLEEDAEVGAASEAWERLGEFVERDPNVPGAFRFRHALIRDAAYEGLSYKRRRELHARVAEVIERTHGERAEDVAEILALHFHRAERWPETWRYSIEAGRRAAEKYANVEAAQFLEQALDAAKLVPDVPAEKLAWAATTLGDVCVLLGRYEEAREAFGTAEKHVKDDPVQYARLAEKRHWVPIRLGEPAQALRWLTRGIAALEGLDDKEAECRTRRTDGVVRNRAPDSAPPGRRDRMGPEGDRRGRALHRRGEGSRSGCVLHPRLGTRCSRERGGGDIRRASARDLPTDGQQEANRRGAQPSGDALVPWRQMGRLSGARRSGSGRHERNRRPLVRRRCRVQHRRDARRPGSVRRGRACRPRVDVGLERGRSLVRRSGGRQPARSDPHEHGAVRRSASAP